MADFKEGRCILCLGSASGSE